ncbi:MAG TPA: recombination mediator RecR [Chthonomonas sp.]|jgi:recombination protein RecR|uniref:recombination mediator RecR n=1 Tax=Chthonomonas sp. TaxID=2282153 RepID=UPI002B4AD326|nr:recombination mediator RecR [Chthonomonas sp.]HLH79806.1 recombination mediator RecR [Chthonomonas sp.]
MLHYPKPLAKLVAELERLPGVGPKSAQRMAFYLLRQPKEEAAKLAEAILQVKETIRLCKECSNFTDQELCEICRDPERDRTLLCVVAETRDLIAMEKTNEYNGLYHVLQGLISPMDNITPEMLRIRELFPRVANGVQEVILAFNSTTEGQTTALYLANRLRPLGVKVTQIAHGLPAGGELDYADQATLISALQWRREI